MPRKKITNFLNLESFGLLLSLIAIFGAGIYYFYALNRFGLVITLALSVSAWLFIMKRLFRDKPEKTKEEDKPEKNLLNLILLATYTLIYLALFYILWSKQSDRPLISPWEIVPGYFWPLFILLNLTLIFILSRRYIRTNVKLVCLTFHYLINFSVALLIYKINYGFDPFIHQATLELIAKNGSVDPKPLYYLGEYSLIISLHKIFGFSIYWLNRLLVPFIAAIFLPAALSKFLTSFKGDAKSNNTILLAILGLLALPFSIFIISTPQNLAYIFLILSLLASFDQKKNLTVSTIFSLAACAVHPLAGLAGLGWLAFLAFDKYRNLVPNNRRKLIIRIIFSLFCLSWPIAFYASTGGGFKLNAWSDIISQLWLPSSFFPNQENIFLNFSYFIYFNYPGLIAILVALGLYNYYKTRPTDSRFAYLNLASLGIAIAWVLSNLLSFNSLIDYEQNNYARRLLVILVIFQLPFLLWLIESFMTKVLKAKPLEKIIWSLLLALLLSVSLYTSYPRRDNYLNSRGYAVSRADIEAVNFIDKNSQGDYVVLANQQTSAAALKELGFDHYYPSPSGPIYFYPIPTGGPLYQFYLDMVYKKPDRASVLKAMDLVGVDEAYFVINKYWKDSRRIIENAKLEADSFESINKGEIYVFRYKR
ncbi:MAG: hypothetical protein WC441_03240 [Patescibacteria group bacterium]